MSSQVLISKSALVHNIRAYKRVVRDAKIMSVVKSEAYGHNMILVARAIQKETDWFGVASGSEALALRKAGIRKPILVLSFYDEAEILDLVKAKVSLVIYDLKQAAQISRAAVKLKRTANVHLKIDTGTSRIGVLPKDFVKFLDKLLLLPNIKIEGVFSHFASSEDDFGFTEKQNRLFNAAILELKSRGLNPVQHIACTAAGITAPDSQHDMVRLGIGLYGLWPSESVHSHAKFELKSALSWQTGIIQVKEVPKGTYISYGKTFQTKRTTKIAVLPIGYFDGFDRKLSNSGEVFIKGKKCKVLGRVCMNLTMVDVTDLKDAKAGDRVELIGKEITADELAKKIGTINYEIVARINPLIQRILIK